MPDTEEPGLPAETFGQALERIAEGGLLRLLAGKPIQQAIGRLISGAVDVPAAYFERWTQGVRSDTAAQKQITSAIATAARAAAAKDPELIDRGLERWTRQLGAKQRTREDIAVRTLNVLAEGEMPQEAAAPTEDFMRMFEDIAEKVSSAELADLMARILAGEIRKPGSVSRRTLAVVAVLDREIVYALAEVMPCLLNGGWVHISPGEQEKWRERFSLLSSVSISSDVGPRSLNFDADRRCAIRIGNDAVVLTLGPVARATWFVDGAHLTPIGRELASVLPLLADAKLQEIALGFKEHDFLEKVEIGSVSEAGRQLHIADLRAVA